MKTIQAILQFPLLSKYSFICLVSLLSSFILNVLNEFAYLADVRNKALPVLDAGSHKPGGDNMVSQGHSVL